jgi:hypothetical protein
MTGQSRLMSLVEAIVNVGISYGLAVLTQIVVLPIFGLQTSLRNNLTIASIFTVVSIARSYVLRRAFEAIRAHGPGGITAGHVARRHRPF